MSQYIDSEDVELLDAPPKVAPEPVSNGIGVRHSQTIGAITKALADAQLAFQPIKKNTENPFYKSKYADLSAVIAATQPGLAKNGLVVTQFPKVVNNRVRVTTILSHASGEWMADDLDLPMSKPDAQGTGSAITYARRYSYQSIVGVSAEDDDDGNAAVGGGKPAVVQAPQRKSAPKPEELQPESIKFNVIREPEPTLSDKQLKRLFAISKAHNVPDADIKTYMKEAFGIEHSRELKREQYDTLCEWMEAQ